MKIYKLFIITIVILSTGMYVKAQIAAKNANFELSLNDKRIIVTNLNDGSKLCYEPDFLVLYSAKNPEKQLRRGDFGYMMEKGEDMGVLYNVPTWGQPDIFVKDKNEHVEDGFNPELDRSYGMNRTANYFKSAKSIKITAINANIVKKSVVWTFKTQNEFTFEASICLSTVADGLPRIEVKLTPKKEGWFSAGYVGAPQCNASEIDEIWQATIWQERRFPNESFLSESFRLTIPTAFVTIKGITIGVAADPKYIPFDPIPNSNNSQFGVMVRNEVGNAQPILFAPVLGNENSHLNVGANFAFEMYIYQRKSKIVDSYKELAEKLCDFKDFRKNSTCNMNTTIENMTEFCLSPYGGFIDSLRGCNYSTDVPGAVKNISGLHPLEVAILTDNEAIFKKYARPMLEYGLSRERFLFSTNNKVNGQGASSKLSGPGVPMSDLSATYTYSNNKLDYFLADAKKLYVNKVVRSINLDAIYFEDRWQNAMFLYKATGEKQYLEIAKVGADKYLKARVYTKQTNYQDKASMGMFFWTSYTNQWMELYQLYKMTGKRRYLDAAHEGARYYAMFCWMVPVVPEGMITVNKGGIVPLYRDSPEKYKPMHLPETKIESWKVSELGLTPESSGTSAGHRGIFMAHHAPFMMRIAAETGDTYLRNIARAAVVGRYESFPGYHINAGRTNAFEMRDFARQPQEVLNAHTSIHYNHPWSHVAMLWDYLISDLYYVSDKKIDFPFEYSEGYGYCRSLIYGAHKGKFYGEENVQIYMPDGLLKLSNVQVNYVSGFGNNKFYVAFLNQTSARVNLTITIDTKKLKIDQSKNYIARVWNDNKPAGMATISDGKLNITVSSNGLTAIAIDDVSVEPGFQKKFYKESTKWNKNYTSVGFDNDRAVLLDFGDELKSVYVWNEANNNKYKEVALHYAIDGIWGKVQKRGYPFEYTIEIPKESESFEYRFEAITPSNQTIRSNIGSLSKNISQK